MDAPELLRQAAELAQQLVTINPDEPFKTGAKLVSMGGTLLTAGTTFTTKTYPWLRAKLDSRSVSHGLGKTIFTARSIEPSLRYYVPPDTQSLDPAGDEESRLIHPVRERLFKALDNVLDSASKERYYILLADSGMGKTSALLNYYARHRRRWRKPFNLALVPLGMPNADEKIKAIEDKHRTVLFLDSLDEDTLAMVDHRERLRLLMQEVADFPRVLITCRTQFFTKDEEIPTETGIVRPFDRPAGEAGKYRFIKIYLTPFTDRQVKKYLRRRYPLWQRRSRRAAFRLVAKVPHLTARPMLLAHIETLLGSNRPFNYSFEVYEEMVIGWIERERGFIDNPEQLRTFSERLAVDLYVNRKSRGGEIVSKPEIEALAREWRIEINADSLSGRGLLNRDAVGNFKFAHRSIMEHLFVQSFIKAVRPVIPEEGREAFKWTDQMKTFLWETMEHFVANSSSSLGPFYEFLDSRFVPGRDEGLLADIARHAMRIHSKMDPLSYSGKTFLALLIFILRMRGFQNVDMTLWLAGKGERRYGVGGKDIDRHFILEEVSTEGIMSIRDERIIETRLKRVMLLFPYKSFICTSLPVPDRAPAIDEIDLHRLRAMAEVSTGTPQITDLQIAAEKGLLQFNQTSGRTLMICATMLGRDRTHISFKSNSGDFRQDDLLFIQSLLTVQLSTEGAVVV